MCVYSKYNQFWNTYVYNLRYFSALEGKIKSFECVSKLI